VCQVLEQKNYNVCYESIKTHCKGKLIYEPQHPFCFGHQCRIKEIFPLHYFISLFWPFFACFSRFYGFL